MFISKKRYNCMMQRLVNTEKLAGRALELATFHEEEFQQLNRNGMATIVNKLQKEVLVDKKDVFSPMTSMAIFGDAHVIQEPSLKGKVDAIVKHLGLKFDVLPAKKSEIVAVKGKVTKKKGRR